MSMISAQIDELRELAGDGSMEWVAGPIRASVLRDAADTIWQLRDDLQRTNAENAKLREERDHWHVEQVHAYGNWEDAHKRAAELQAENAKLRELMDYMTPIAWYAASERERDRMRELGVEVDG